jgi:hypothetical protein
LQSGDYGLHVVIALEDANDALDRLDLYFDATTNMFGNPYAFKIFT